MTDPIVTHADLPALREIRQGICDGDGGCAMDDCPGSGPHPPAALLDRLIAAAEADRQVIDEPTWRGAVVKDRRGVEWVRVHPGGDAWVNVYLRWASWGEVEGVELVLPPNARPAVTEADVQRAVRGLGAVPGCTIDKSISKALAALGIEVTP